MLRRARQFVKGFFDGEELEGGKMVFVLERVSRLLLVCPGEWYCVRSGLELGKKQQRGCDVTGFYGVEFDVGFTYW